MKDSKDLLRRYTSGEITADEKLYVDVWLDMHHVGDNAWDGLTEEDKKLFLASISRDLDQKTELNQTYKLKPWRNFALIAAALVIMLGVWVFGFSSMFSGFGNDNESRYANDIAPGKNIATMTLPNGQTIQLSENKTGIVVYADKLAYSDGAELEGAATMGYLSDDDSKPAKIATPLGGQYQVVLPDGTRAWLNAASSIQFSTRLDIAKKRIVKITGEVYLEVYPDKARPFTVESEGQQVDVLGTHFNINSYAEDGATVKTTLLEGNVKVSSGAQSIVLSMPGQQSLLKGKSIQSTEVRPEEVIAWKEGHFRFVDQDITEIMSQIARWYNVDVIYEGDVSGVKLNASILRNRNVSQVLKMMEKTDEVHFKIEGRRIFVRK